ncbi:E3 ubiquitin-protein ligase [Mycena indigotica]|uniref:E3 ubiquitin-protein ligase n=1 Tax=Mycena indigotica TaxID=2126181 RepID=A0A8H6SA09_9AGAR|nr:E3 ubiquitin-protein ligase [Mycena indigotica]KAF7295603.1 E3 ubiquitin-protein ligase [Mycena indigotica]
MSLSSFFPTKFLSRPPEPPALAQLRELLETLPVGRQYNFTADVRAEILVALYDAFWGGHAELFLPPGNTVVPIHRLLSECQTETGMVREDVVVPGRPCTHVFKKGESCYRCKDCTLDDSCVLCSRCFHATQHEGHNVSFFIAQQPGGCCDCGDDEAWRSVINCPFHPILPTSPPPRTYNRPIPDDVPVVPNYPLRVTVPTDLRDSMTRTVALALDFILETLDYSPDEPTIPADEGSLRLQPSADPALREHYCVVLWNDDKHSYEEVTKLLTDLTGVSKEDAGEITRRIDEEGRGVVASSADAARLLTIAHRLAQIDLGVTIRRGHDTFRECILAVLIEWLLDLTRAQLGSDALILKEIVGKELLTPPRAKLTSHSEVPNRTRIDCLFLDHTKLWKSPRLMIKEIYAGILGLSRDWKLAIAGHFASVYPLLVSSYLLVDREAETSIKYFALQLFTVPSASYHVVRNHRLVSRILGLIQGFFLNRIEGKRVVCIGMGDSGSSLTLTYPPVDPDSPPFKSKRFMPVFSDLRYLCHTLPVQRLIAADPRGYVGMFARTCAIFVGVGPNRRAVTSHVEYENDAWISVFNVTLSLGRVVKVFGEAFGGGRSTTTNLITAIGIVLHHILVVCAGAGTGSPEDTEPDGGRLIEFHEAAFGCASTTLPTEAISEQSSRRQYTLVKFDVSSGPVSFHHSLHWLLAELLKHVDVLDPLYAGPASGLGGSINAGSSLGSPNATHEMAGGLGEVFGRLLVKSGSVGSSWSSTASTTSWKTDSVKPAITGDSVMTDESRRKMLAVVDFPLRVLAMIAQIRTGLWVRNGFVIRGQLLHYRDFMLRELCYDQDLFILQSALVILDCDTVFVSILDRFGVREFFDPETTREEIPPSSSSSTSSSSSSFASTTSSVGSTTPGTSTPSAFLLHSTYEPAQLANMVEELLYVIITILSENASASGMSIEQAVRREIVHALAIGPCVFTDLVKRVAERLVEDVCFERVLGEVAKFRAPEGSGNGGGGGADVGTYELRDEVYDEVNPFFFHYTRNRREEVEGVLLARLRKTMGVQDPVIVPKPMGIERGPFVNLAACFESEVLLQIMFYALHNILVLTDAEGSSGAVPSSAEAILDMTLHLIMLGVVERKEGFAKLLVGRWFPTGELQPLRLLDVIWRVGEHEKYRKIYGARVDWILGQMEAVPGVREEVLSRKGIVQDSADAASGGKKADAEDARKRAMAKARQEALMRQMKAQQASFAFNLEEEGMDEDGDGDEPMEDAADEDRVSFGTCIVCQEDLNALRPFGMLGLIQPSRFIRRHPDSHNAYLNEVLQTPASMDRIPQSTAAMNKFPPPQAEALDAKASSSSHFDGFPTQFTRFGLHSSVCTHMMHLDCFQVYSVSIRQRHRTQSTRNHPESIPRKEYICPLCKSLGNVILPVTNPPKTALIHTPFPDWIRSAGIGILKSKPDPLLDSLQFRNGTGEFVFWSAQDPGYNTTMRSTDRWEGTEAAKMIDTVMVVAKSVSQQTRHLRDRPEPEVGERGAGIYLPEEVIGYTICAIEIAQRSVEAANSGMVVDNLSDAQMGMIRGLLTCLAKLAALHFKDRADEGRDAVKQAIIKRLLPEWSRTSLTSFSYPLLLRDPFTVLVETAAVAPEMLRHVLILAYYACLARTVIGLVYVLNKTRSHSTTQVPRRAHEDIFGDVRMFFMSVVRHSPVFEHTATLVFETFGEARIEKLLYTFTLPFLRRAAILCRSVLPASFPTPSASSDVCEYNRLLTLLNIPALSDLPNQDTLQNALSGWCAHYGHSHAASQLNCGVVLDYPATYKLARLPLVLDNLFGVGQQERALTCSRCLTMPVDAAICLLCGTTVCMQSDCCRDEDGERERGECNMHLRDCGGAIGVYFLVKRCMLLYIYANNGTFAPPPYLDAHGEVDISMRRGRRQYLHYARWEEVRKTWLSHGIPTVIARRLEASLDSGGWETL